ncbi:probable 2-oxoglutarate-dependent dioxygenase AOP1.2 [Olea europaea var. sylvestris]|uniref:probable 2-oxoglutarate-dependent dioxygenase AOP1.2 n=1 Tax=Olea europaea var. sylvestris TaxID=158386 RepID=UPI000C1CE32F|nr:probable 2-oxoglutarate-dependent dioxygenase AOP1.2 [Olea europaea var. sylvestris]
MGSDSETIKLPTIDFSEVKQGTQTWDLVKNQVRRALEEYGCFEALFDKIPKGTRKATLDALKELFDLPLQIKLKNRSNKPYHGYVGQHAFVPLYESLGIGNALALGKIENFANLMWPNGNPTFSEAVQSFSEQLSELDQIVRRMTIESLGVEKYMDEHMESTDYLVRMQKYDGPQSNETKLGLTSHTDKNIVTILYQSEVTGLEVLTKDGKWITVEPSLDSFIVMIGDSFLVSTS